MRSIVAHAQKRASGNVLAEYGGTLGWCAARMAVHGRRVQAERFVKTGQHVRESIDAAQCDLVGRCKRAANLVNQLLVHLRVSDEVVCRSAEQRRCGFAPG